MVKCPYCRVDFENTPYAEKLDVAELSKDTVIICCPHPNCNMFQVSLGMEEGEEEANSSIYTVA